MDIAQKMGFTLFTRWLRGLESKLPCGYVIAQYLSENPHVDQRSRLKAIFVAAKTYANGFLHRHTADTSFASAHRSFSSALDCFIDRMEQDQANSPYYNLSSLK